MLAASDFISLSFCISFLHHILTEGTCLYSTAVWYSYLEQLCVNIPMSTSVLIIICVTVDRYFSICRPTDFKRIHTKRYARAGILGSLLIAVAVWLPTCALKKPTLYDDCETSSFVAPDNRTWWVPCMVTDIRNNPYYIAYTWVRQTLISFLPIVILILLNILIIREFIRLRQKGEMRVGGGPQHRPPAGGRRRDEQHLITLLTAVMISFFITMVPAGVFNALYTEALTSEIQFEIFRAVANILEIVNHALNFYIYILCSKPIREAITSFFLRHQGVVVDLPVPDVIVVQQVDTGDGSSARPPDASTPRANIIHRTQGDAGGEITQREKSKTVSRETEPSDIPSDGDSNVDNSEAEVSSSTNDKHGQRKVFDKASETLYLKGNIANRVNGVEVNSTESERGRGAPETEKDPTLEGWETPPHAGRGLVPQAAATPTRAPSLDEDVKGCYNEAFTLEE